MKKIIFLFALLLASLFLTLAPLCAEDGKAASATAEVAAVKKIDAKDVQRVSPADIYEKVQTGEALLVCAYPDDEKFAKNNLKGAISLKQFETMAKDAGQSKLIVFYWGWKQDASAASLAAQYAEKGYNAKVLGGGIKAWKEAGYEIIAPAEPKK